MSTAAPNDVVNVSGNTVMYWCPGCGDSHAITVGDGPGPRWSWDGDRERPTFAPSVLVRSGHHARHHKPGAPCWCSMAAAGEDTGGFKCYLCHSWVRGGMVELLSDSTHENAGKTLPMQPWSNYHG